MIFLKFLLLFLVRLLFSPVSNLEGCKAVLNFSSTKAFEFEVLPTWPAVVYFLFRFFSLRSHWLSWQQFLHSNNFSSFLTSWNLDTRLVSLRPFIILSPFSCRNPHPKRRRRTILTPISTCPTVDLLRHRHLDQSAVGPANPLHTPSMTATPTKIRKRKQKNPSTWQRYHSKRHWEGIPHSWTAQWRLSRERARDFSIFWSFQTFKNRLFSVRVHSKKYHFWTWVFFWIYPPKSPVFLFIFFCDIRCIFPLCYFFLRSFKMLNKEMAISACVHLLFF